MEELDSPVADFSLLPRLRRKHMESGQTAVQVSTTIGWNWYARLVQMGVLLGFLNMRHCPTCFLGGYVRESQGVHTGGIPHQEPPI